MRAVLRTPEVQAAIGACRSEKAQLCPDVVRGSGRVVRCLAEKLAQLTPGCRKAMIEAHHVLVSAGLVKPRTPPTR